MFILLLVASRSRRLYILYTVCFHELCHPLLLERSNFTCSICMIQKLGKLTYKLLCIIWSCGGHAAVTLWSCRDDLPLNNQNRWLTPGLKVPEDRLCGGDVWKSRIADQFVHFWNFLFLIQMTVSIQMLVTNWHDLAKMSL